MSARRKYGVNGTVGPARGFTWSEVDDGYGKLPSTQDGLRRVVRQARLLNQLRAYIAGRYDVPKKNVGIGVNSWYRSGPYNRAIGGASQSQHVEARATDIVVVVKRKNGRVVRLSPAWVGKLAAAGVPAFRDGGIGVYGPAEGNFTHVDHRPNGPARWTGH